MACEEQRRCQRLASGACLPPARDEDEADVPWHTPTVAIENHGTRHVRDIRAPFLLRGAAPTGEAGGAAEAASSAAAAATEGGARLPVDVRRAAKRGR